MIKYSLVMRGKPGKPEEPKQVFASAQSIKKMSLEEVAKYIKQHGCAYNVGDFFSHDRHACTSYGRPAEGGVSYRFG